MKGLVALALAAIFLWALALIPVRNDKGPRHDQRKTARPKRHHWVSGSGKRWREVGKA